MTTMSQERVCEREGCGKPVTGRADKRFCSDACRAETSRNRTVRRSDNRTAARLATVTPIRAEPLTWDPPSEPLGVCETDDRCPECGELLYESPRGNGTACVACRMAVEPPGVLGTYPAGETRAEPRQVIGDRERADAEDMLVRRKGELLARLAALAVSPQLDPASAYPVEWLTAKVRKARSLAELAALAGRASALGIRQRDAVPAAIEREVVQGEVIEDSPPPGRPVPPPRRPGGLRAILGPPVAAAPERPVTAMDALKVLGLEVALVSAAGGCQVASAGVRCRGEVRFPVAGAAPGRDVWVCAEHNYAIGRVLSGRRTA